MTRRRSSPEDVERVLAAGDEIIRSRSGIRAFDRWFSSGFVALIGVALVATSFADGRVRAGGVVGGLVVIASGVTLWLALGRTLLLRRRGQSMRPYLRQFGLIGLAVALFAGGALVSRTWS